MSLVVKNVQGLELVGGFILIPNILILMTHVVSAISDSVGTILFDEYVYKI
jgi:hypothetical protein